MDSQIEIFFPEIEDLIKFQLQDNIQDIQPHIGDEIIESIKQSFKQLIKIPVTFREYVTIIGRAIILNMTTDALIFEVLINLEVPQNTETNKVKEQSEHQTKTTIENNKNKQEFINSLSYLKDLALKTTYSRRIAFIQRVLNSSNKKEVLYKDTPFTEEEINKRYRKLAFYFHPDKTNKPNTPNYLQDKHKNLGAVIFEASQEFREILLSELRVASNNDGLNFHEKKANGLWKYTIDFVMQLKDNWTN